MVAAAMLSMVAVAEQMVVVLVVVVVVVVVVAFATYGYLSPAVGERRTPAVQLVSVVEPPATPLID